MTVCSTVGAWRIVRGSCAQHIPFVVLRPGPVCEQKGLISWVSSVWPVRITAWATCGCHRVPGNVDMAPLEQGHWEGSGGTSSLCQHSLHVVEGQSAFVEFRSFCFCLRHCHRPVSLEFIVALPVAVWVISGLVSSPLRLTSPCELSRAWRMSQMVAALLVRRWQTCWVLTLVQK